MERAPDRQSLRWLDTQLRLRMRKVIFSGEGSKVSLLEAHLRIGSVGSALEGGPPIIGTRGARDRMFPINFSICQRHPDQLGIVGFVEILAMGHLAIDLDDGGIGQQGTEKVLLTPLNRGAKPLERHLGQHSPDASALYIKGTALFGATVKRNGLWAR